MSAFLCNIGINLLSDLIFIFLGIAIFWLYYQFSTRNKLLKFFGITKSKKITIYLSNLRIMRGWALGIDEIPHSFQGSAISYEESKVAWYLQSIFNYFLPSQIDKPEILNKLLITDINVQLTLSPFQKNVIEQGATIISLGLPVYNLVSENIEDSWKLDVKSYYVPVDEVSNPSDKKKRQQIIAVKDVQDYSDKTYGFVQRIFDHKNKRNIFYIAGIDENSTAGSAYYLADNWKKLFNTYGPEKSFLIMLKIDEHNNRLSEKIFDK